MARKLISFDWAIKKILRSKANFGILEGFLSELLFTDITILEILESESNQNREHDKYNRVDIKVIDANQKIIIIEIQYSREMDYLQRILFASAKAITEHLVIGASYSDVSKVISINILYFDFGKGDDYIYHGTTNFIGLHNHSELQLSEEQKRLRKAMKIYCVSEKYFESIINETHRVDLTGQPVTEISPEDKIHAEKELERLIKKRNKANAVELSTINTP